MHPLLSAVAQLVMVADQLYDEEPDDDVRCELTDDADSLAGDISRTAYEYRARILELADALDAISPGSCAGVRAALGGE